VLARLRNVPLFLIFASLSALPASNLREGPGGGDASFDSKSFFIGNQRRLLLCGGVHYFRFLPEEWRDRLLLTRLAGFNMVETPIPWSLHQPTKDEWRIDGPADLPRFLDLCHEQKLLAFVRIGPYVNAALSRGGLPPWLGDDPKLLIRSSNEPFLDAVRQYWAKLLPLLVARQVPRGPVALVQIEDTYRGPDDRYLSRLYDEVNNSGLRVPIVLSDLNPSRGFQRTAVPDTQVYATTELMPEGPLLWGERRKPFDAFGDILIEGLAKGVDGFNHAMWAAGTNLVLLPGSNFPTRFEASTSGLLEGGGESSVYDQVKRANWFARAFEPLLAQATALAGHPVLDQGKRAALIALGRSDGQAALLFFKRRYGTGDLPLKDPATGLAAALPTDANQFRHVVLNFPLTPKTTLAFSTAQVFAVPPTPGRCTLVVYAPSNAEAVMAFHTNERPDVKAGADALAWDDKAKQLVLRWRCAAKGERKDFVFQADLPVHVIALEESQVAHSWVLEGAGILVGASSVGEWTAGDKPTVVLRLPTRRLHYALTFYPTGNAAGVAPANGISDVKHDPAAGRIDCSLALDLMEPIALFLRKWEAADTLAEAEPGFDDSSWRETLRPEPMADAAHGWHRCRLDAPKAATRKLVLDNLADSATVYLNGQYVGQSPTKRLIDGPRGFAQPAHFDLALKAGENVLAIIVKNWGCYRNTSSYGLPLHAASGWGILGNVALDGKATGRWRQREGLSPQGRALAWKALEPKSETRNPKSETDRAPIRWFRTTFSLRKQPSASLGPGPAHHVPRLILKGPSCGALWLNGHYLGLYSQSGAEAGQGYYLPAPWLRDTNELILLEEGGQAPAEGEVRFDRAATYVPLRLDFGDAAAPEPPTKKGKARPKR